MARPAWHEEGIEPDYRFTLANERTFLAWVRTTLALVAAAVAVVQLVPPFGVPGADIAIGAALGLTALGTAVLSYTRWRDNERAIRRSAPLPHSRGLVVLSTTLAVVVGLVVALLVLEGV
ncbi:DUF202 domain-containing protein [Nocardioides sp. BGMRC 2183]|nr:DUF202 domain-containing protein [Nocardioides sp. BGMRC 2183]